MNMTGTNTQTTEKVAVSVKEMSQMLGINIQSAYELTRRKGFPAIRVTARRIIIPVDALNRWLNSEGIGG